MCIFTIAIHKHFIVVCCLIGRPPAVAGGMKDVVDREVVMVFVVVVVVVISHHFIIKSFEIQKSVCLACAIKIVIFYSDKFWGDCRRSLSFLFHHHESPSIAFFFISTLNYLLFIAK
jgi:hypothetical protein